MTPRKEKGHQLARQTERDGTPSITLASVAVGMMRASLRSAELSRAQYPASVRSRPPIITSMFRSTNLPEDVATLGRMTGSIIGTLTFLDIANRLYAKPRPFSNWVAAFIVVEKIEDRLDRLSDQSVFNNKLLQASRAIIAPTRFCHRTASKQSNATPLAFLVLMGGDLFCMR